MIRQIEGEKLNFGAVASGANWPDATHYAYYAKPRAGKVTDWYGPDAPRPRPYIDTILTL